MFKSNPFSNFNWKDGLKIALAAMTFGIGWFADNQTAVVAYAAVLIVWLLGVLAQASDKFKWLKGKGALTVLIFVVSFGISYLSQPFTFDPLPPWAGDAGAYVPLFSAWVSGVFTVIGNAVLLAMSVYNLLLAQVLEKLPTAFALKK